MMRRHPLAQVVRDRRITAVHEAGHVIVGHHIGVRDVKGWLIPVENPGPHESHWVGKMQWRTDGVSLDGQRLIAVAGFAAELVWRRQDDERLDGWIPVYDHLAFPESMSLTDWENAGCEPGDPDDAMIAAAEQVVQMIGRDGPLWPALVAEARRMIVESRRGA